MRCSERELLILDVDKAWVEVSAEKLRERLLPSVFAVLIRISKLQILQGFESHITRTNTYLVPFERIYLRQAPVT